MTARSLHEIIRGEVNQYGLSRHRVRRDGFPRGSREAQCWRPFSRRQMGAAEGYERQNKLPRKRNGPLRHVRLRAKCAPVRFPATAGIGATPTD